MLQFLPLRFFPAVVLIAFGFLPVSAPAQVQPQPGGKRFSAPVLRLPPSDPRIRTTGRWERSSNNGPTAAWSGCRIEFTVRDAPSADVLLRGRAGVRFDVRVDGEPLKTVVALEDSRTNYRVAAELDPARPHRIELRKRTEPLFGETQFLGLELAGGGELAPVSPTPPVPIHHIEFIGDSITCGYGVEAASEREHFSPETENFNLTFAGLTADALKAEPMVVAWTGSCLSAKIAAQLGWAKCLPVLYPLTLPERGDTQWDFASWTPDVVVVNLGTNDFSASPPPDPATWATEYAGFLASVRSHYPKTAILCATGPMLDAVPLTALRSAVRTAVEARRRGGDLHVQTVEFPPQNAARDGLGADYHPSRATHRRMTEQLTASIRSTMGW